MLLITSSDGRFVLINRNARIERSIVAHQGVITAGKWSPDGAGIMTAGEDGTIKIWSKSGMLRTTVVQNEQEIRCAVWSANSLSIAYCQQGFMAIKPLAATSKLRKWRAHEGLVLSLCWSNDSMYLASAGEDCRYRIWDENGSTIFISSPKDHPITGISFSPNNNYLCVGSFNSLKLCHSFGWSYNYAKFTEQSIGSLSQIRWSMDGSQVAAGSSAGYLVLGYVIEMEKRSKNLTAKTVEKKTINLHNVLTQSSDTLEFPDRIIQWDIGYEHLVVATLSQIHVYNEKYTNTPLSIIDGRHDVRIIILGKKYFLTVDNSSCLIYTYAGRLQSNPKHAGFQSQIQNLTSKQVSLGQYHVAIRDATDQSQIFIFQLISNATIQNDPSILRHNNPIVEISLCRAGLQIDQCIAFTDVNQDLFSVALNGNSDFEIIKIGTQTEALQWGSESNILIGMHDSCYTVWYCPSECSSDPSLIGLTTVTTDISDFGKNVVLDNVEGSQVTFKVADAIYTVQVNLHCEILRKLLDDESWLQALKICRRINIPLMWGTLAILASKKNQLDIAEEAYSAALQIDKVNYLQYIKKFDNSQPEHLAEQLIMIGRPGEAENVLIYGQKISDAIDICIRMHRWEQALEIAKTHQTNVEQVHEERKKYLNALGKSEYLDPFLL